jgi:2',3'-cyclic-nucleotide 2'-phosphodiesterase (5'-nucleotidase family)
MIASSVRGRRYVAVRAPDRRSRVRVGGRPRPLVGLDLASVGNHEFDEGAGELLRIQNGGCHPVDGCADPARPYAGAGFQHLSANAFVTATGQPLLAPYAVREVAGVRIGPHGPGPPVQPGGGGQR